MKTAENFLRDKHYVPSESIPFNEVADFLREYTRINMVEYVKRLRELEFEKIRQKYSRKKR